MTNKPQKTTVPISHVTLEMVRVYADNSKHKWLFKRPQLLHMLLAKAILSGFPDELYPDGPPAAVLDAVRRVKDEG